MNAPELRANSASAARSAIFGGGPLYTGREKVMNDLRSSGFTTVILWSLHVEEDGTLNYNGTKIIEDGEYCGDNTRWDQQLRTLKMQPTTVSRVEVSIGAWKVPDWENIRDLINGRGDHPGSILYRNFAELLRVTGADAINDDDESCYDPDSAVQFGKMLAEIGYQHFTIAPYDGQKMTEWKKIAQGLGSMVDRVYLQCYSGGSSNKPSDWITGLGMNVDPGQSCVPEEQCTDGCTPEQMHDQILEWRKSADIPGAFVWLYDGIPQNPGSTTKDYAAALSKAICPVPEVGTP